MTPWTIADIPAQVGRTAVITGTGGLGYETALALARAGGHVILAGRNSSKGAAAIARIRTSVPHALVRFQRVDLASLQSIAEFGAGLRSGLDSVDLLINNAGVMTPPQRQTSADGFELQFGTNFLGPFALTAQLLPLLRRGRGARVVNVSSIAARGGAIDFEDLQAERRYTPMVAYRQSKLANLLFSLELQRRSEAGAWGVSSIAAHPGVSRTDLIPNGAGRVSVAGLFRTLLWFLFQPASQGALPTLFAATSPSAQGGAYYGPNTFWETRGTPTLVQLPAKAVDARAATRLWDVSERLTGVSYPTTN
jgi:NAD(P)-dependent dehydrogenase (short-subunit alcohol dehydrogenase family)